MKVYPFFTDFGPFPFFTDFGRFPVGTMLSIVILPFESISKNLSPPE
jgi:hypothetical protein